jgi:exodeoxyribonuclease VII small subunit
MSGTYSESIRELEEILRKMQSDQCDIDHLAEYTRRASELIKECRQRLTATEQELATILEGLKEG